MWRQYRPLGHLSLLLLSSGTNASSQPLVRTVGFAAMALRPELEGRGIDPLAPLTIVAVMAAGVFGGWLLYRLVETPFMARCCRSAE